MSVPARVSLATLGVTDVAGATLGYLGGGLLLECYESLGRRLSRAPVPGLVSFHTAGGRLVGFFYTAGGPLSLVSTDDTAADAGLPTRPAPPNPAADFRGTAGVRQLP
jgi:hypothetical protein